MWYVPLSPPSIRRTRENERSVVQPTTSNTPLTGQSVEGSGCRLDITFFLPLDVVRVCAFLKTVILCPSPLSERGESPKVCVPQAHSKGGIVWGAPGGGGNVEKKVEKSYRLFGVTGCRLLIGGRGETARADRREG